MRYYLFLIIFICFNCLKGFSQPNTPKNIIIFIADGGGYNQMMCTDYFLYGKHPASTLSSFPVQLSMSTYNASTSRNGTSFYDSKKFWSDFSYGISAFTESAASATAIGTGYKAHNDVIGLNTDGLPVTNIMEIGKSIGKGTGVITSVPFAHATPAGVSAHTKSRKEMHSIGYQMVANNTLDIVGGAGHPWFDDNGNRLASPNTEMMDTALYSFLKHNDNWILLENRAAIKDFNAKDANNKNLFMLAPVFSTFSEKRDGKSVQPFDVPINKNIPTLSEMSIAALSKLSENKEGFILLIEGGAVDWANHDNDFPRLIEEQSFFYNTVDTVLNWLEKQNILEKTLIIATNDHECGYLWGENSSGNNFYTPKNNGKGKLPDAKYYSDNHSNSLVPFFAKGPSSEIFYSFADEVDSVRGAFLTNSEIAIAVKMLWGNATTIFKEKESNDSVVLRASFPCPDGKIKWYVNNSLQKENETSTFLIDKNIYKKPALIRCEILCGEKQYTSPNYEYIP